MASESRAGVSPPPWVAWVVSICGVLTLVFGMCALAKERNFGTIPGIIDGFFTVAGMITLQSPSPPVPESRLFTVAQLLAMCTAGFGITYVVLGLLGFVRGSAERVQLRLFASDARRTEVSLVVICGLGRVGMQLVRDLCGPDAGGGWRVVVIEIDPGNPSLDAARERGAVVLLGDAADRVHRRRAHLELADEVFVVCGDDATNLDVAARIARDIEASDLRTAQPLLCVAGIGSPSLAKAARDNPIFSGEDERFRLRVLNLADNAALALMKEELGSTHAPSAEEVAHYIVVGFGTVGQAVALQAARLAHFESGRRPRLTIVDDWDDLPVSRARSAFLEQYPAFSPDPTTFDLREHAKNPDTGKDDWSFRAGRPANPAWHRNQSVGADDTAIPIEYVANAEFLDAPTSPGAPELADRLADRLTSDQKPPVRPALIVCFDEDRRNLEAALSLRTALARRGLLPPLFVYLADEEGLATFLARASEDSSMPEVKSFGCCATCATHARLVQREVFQLAEAFHVGHQEKAGKQKENSTAWIEHAFKGSSESAAHHVAIKLAASERVRAANHSEEPAPASVGASAMFTTAARDALARMEHHRYVAERLLDGWRYGPRNDAEKLRDSLCTWESLSEDDRIKDYEQVERLEEWYEQARGGS